MPVRSRLTVVTESGGSGVTDLVILETKRINS